MRDLGRQPRGQGEGPGGLDEQVFEGSQRARGGRAGYGIAVRGPFDWVPPEVSALWVLETNTFTHHLSPP